MEDFVACSLVSTTYKGGAGTRRVWRGNLATFRPTICVFVEQCCFRILVGFLSLLFCVPLFAVL